jgi:hypothetical protein
LLQGIDLEPQCDQGEAVLAQRKGCSDWLADHPSCTKRSQEGNFLIAKELIVIYDLCPYVTFKNRKKNVDFNAWR